MLVPAPMNMPAGIFFDARLIVTLILIPNTARKDVLLFIYFSLYHRIIFLFPFGGQGYFGAGNRHIFILLSAGTSAYSNSTDYLAINDDWNSTLQECMPDCNQGLATSIDRIFQFGRGNFECCRRICLFYS